MKTLSLTFACLAAATLVFAAPSRSEEERRIKLMLDNNPEAGLIDIETGELEVGETRSFSSENGQPVLLTRVEAGFEIEVGGKKTLIELPATRGEGFEFQTFTRDEPGADGKPRQRVIVKRMDGDSKVLFHGDADGPQVEIHGDPAAPHGKEVRIVRIGEGHGDAQKVHVMVKGEADLAAARAKLIASGALEGLDAAARERILAALGGQD